jgi:twitching motility protein PilT
MNTEPHIENQKNPAEHKHEIDMFLKGAIKNKASDLHLKAGQRPKLRIAGDLKNTTHDVMTAEMIEKIVFEILSDTQKQTFQSNGTLDFVYIIDGKHRFRINLFRQRSLISLAARRVNFQVPTFKELHLPAVLEKICDARQGLILIVGPTGCGKTTTIASMINYINMTRSCHIVTIEDPVEYLFEDEKAIVSQREIGIDTKDYDDALTYLMRQDPDVILIGEIRDARTVRAVIRAVETGHLVLSTMYSSSVAHAVYRILDFFPHDERELIRQYLSITIQAIISQVLLPCYEDKGSRIPAMEILIANVPARMLISQGRQDELINVIQSHEEGMQDLIHNLCELVKKGVVHYDEAYKIAPNPEEFRRAMQGIHSTAEL